MLKNTYRQFGLLLSGQVIALFGSSLSGFALGVFSFQQAGSATIYTVIALANILPMFLLSPLAGAVVDKFPRKMIVLAANTATLFIICLLYFLVSEGLLKTWHIICLVTLNSVFAAFVLPTISASIPLMVPSDQLSRANGLIAMALGLVELATPAIAGTLFTYFGLTVILASNFVALVVAMLILIICRVPQPTFSSDNEKTHLKQQTIFASLKETSQFLLKNPALNRLILFYAVIVSLTMAMAILVQPMLLAITDAKSMGMTLSFASSGIIIGSLMMVALKQVQQHIPIITLMALFVGASCIFIPIMTSPALIALGGFFVMCCYPVFDSNNRTLFQRKIEPTQLGRVIGLRNFILGLTQSVMFILVGPLADHVFEPAMQENGWLAPIFGEVFGVGQGRGIALMISLLGCLIVLTTLIALLSKKLRAVDTLKDTIKTCDENSQLPITTS